MNKILKRTLKIVGWIVGSVVLLLLLVVVLIQIPGVQNFARKQIVVYLHKKIGTEVRIDHLSIGFPKTVILEGVYFADQQNDTLLWGRKLKVDLAMFKLLRSEVEINEVALEGIRAKIYRNEGDTAFNYQYIVDAFVTEQKKPKDTTSAPMRFDVKYIHLHQVTASFFDWETGSDLYASVGDFKTRIRKFNLDSLDFHVPDIKLDGLVARIYQHKPMVEPRSTAEVAQANQQPMTLNLKLDNLALEKIDFDFKNDVSAFQATTQFDLLHAKVERLNLDSLYFHLNKLKLDNSRTLIVMGNTEQAEEVEKQVETTAQVQAAKPWDFVVDELDLNNNDLKFDNNTEPRQPKGMDYAHLGIVRLTLHGNDLAFTPREYRGIITQGSFYEQSGFELKELKTEFLYNDQGAFLNNLYLETPKTLLRKKLAATWPSLAALSNDIGSLGILADLEDSRVALSDVLIFAPMLASQPPFYRNENAVFDLALIGKGYLRDLDIEQLYLRGMAHTEVNIAGRITGLPNADRTVYNLNIARLQSTQQDLNKLLPPGTLPPDIRLPEAFQARGTFAGALQNFNTRLFIQTSRGTADIDGNIRGMGKNYNLTASVGNLDLGYILKQEKTLGRVTAQVRASGAGFDPKTMVVNANGRVISAGYNGYTYRNLAFDAKMNRGNAVVHADMHDPNLAFSLEGNAQFKGDYPAVQMNLMLDSADLQALGFYKEDFRAHGHIVADIPSSNPDALEGTINIYDIVLATQGRRILTDSVVILAANTDTGHTIQVQSEALVANLSGQYKLTELGDAVQQVIHKYYQLPGAAPRPLTSPQLWTLQAQVLPSDLLFSLAPQLQGTDTVNARVAFNSQQEDMNVQVQANRIVSGTNRIDSLNLTAQTGEAFTYNLSIRGAGNKQFRLFETAISGAVDTNTLTANINTKDPEGKTKYKLGADLRQAGDDGFHIALKPDLMLDYENWDVPADNYIEYTPAGIVVYHFSMSHGAQSLSANSERLEPTAPVNIQFQNFRIATLTRIAEQDSLLVDGIINGRAAIENPMKQLTFNADMNIANLSYRNDTVGNLAIRADNEQKDAIDAHVALKGNNNDVQVDGVYYTANQNLDFKLLLNNLDLRTIQAFAPDQIDSAGGSLRGNLDITGTTADPKLNGGLRFQNAFVAPTLLGERFALSEEEIAINNTGIHLGTFTLTDSANNQARIAGDVLTNNLTDPTEYRFALNVSADNFRAVNASRAQTNRPFYGQLYLSTQLEVAGDMNLPVVQGNLRINKGTDFKFVLPSNDPEVQSRMGVVKFVDINRPHDTVTFAHLETDTALIKAKGIDLSANITTDSAANFTVVIDERNGDALKLRGSANLNTTIDRSGKVSLTGTYLLSEGSYLLTLNFLKRQFAIQSGSTITWNGEPTDATVDVTAVYQAEIPPIDLVLHQLPADNQAEINRYKQKLPFQVLLHMDGQLMKPVISFDIVLPDRYASQWQDVSAKLEQVRNDQSELNKQVFAVLLLNHFVDENPFESAAGGNSLAEQLVRQSASRILTDQLNRLAGNLIQGVDLTFGVNSGSDYSSGELAERTDLTVGVSKRLLNDRLSVNVGSSFMLEGPAQSNQQASNIAGDVSVDYQLSKDGRYMVRAYRRNEYESVTEGQVIETGASFIFKIEYNKFREFFRNPNKKKEK